MKFSINKTARIGGLLYLINIVFGFFAIGYVPGIIITGDAQITAHNILLHEMLYRLGLAAHIIILITNIPLAVIFCKLFNVVNRNITWLVVFFTLVGTAIESVNLLNQFVPLVLLKENYSNTFTPQQITSLAYSFHHINAIGVNLAFVFFGFYGLCIGSLIFRSAFFPRTIGVLMMIGGLCYIINSFANFLAPSFAVMLFPYIQLPSGLAELTFCLWLIFKGVNVTKWQEKANPGAVSRA